MPRADGLAELAMRRAEQTPAAIWQELIRAALPQRPVAKRKVSSDALADYLKDVEQKLADRQPRGFQQSSKIGRRRVAKDRRYEWIGYDSSRYGTFRSYMLGLIRNNGSTAEALAEHKASGRYPDQSINFSWAEKEGYIRFTS